MGVGVSKNKSRFDVINESLTENLNSTMISIAQQSVSSVQPTQIMTVRPIAVKGDITISGLEQVIIVNVDVQKFLSNTTETELRSQMISALEATARDNQAVDHQLILGASYSQNESEATIRNRNVHRVVNSYSYSQFVSDTQEIFAQQELVIAPTTINGDIVVKNISQYVKIELLAKQIATNMTKTLMDMETEASMEAQKETTQTASAGLSTAWLVSGIIMVVVIIAIIAGFVWYFGGSDIVKEQVAKGGAGAATLAYSGGRKRRRA